jgi:hypothetical protein
LRRAGVRFAATKASEDPVKNLFIQKLKEYQKNKPKDYDLKRALEELAKLK